jgi:hypothetical protein
LCSSLSHDRLEPELEGALDASHDRADDNLEREALNLLNKCAKSALTSLRSSSLIPNLRSAAVSFLYRERGSPTDAGMKLAIERG